jgi:hypothetical protein
MTMNTPAAIARARGSMPTGVRYTTGRGRERDDFLEWVANISTSDENGGPNKHDTAVLDRIIKAARRMTTASGPLGMLLEDENVDPAFRRALARTEEVG